MNETENSLFDTKMLTRIRGNCLELALRMHQQDHRPEGIVQAAQQFEDFILGKGKETK